jgi:hypothetical protein
MNRPTKTFLRLIAALAALYLISFAFVFQVFSSPVRTNQAGWLGPAKRSNPQTTDIGEVYYYNGTDFGAYRFYRPLCIGWLWLAGLT